MRVLRIARLEGRLLLADSAVWLMLVIFGVSIVFAIWNGARVIAQRERTIVEFTSQEREHLTRTRAEAVRITSDRRQGQEPTTYWNATRPATAAFYNELSAVLPLSPLAALALGDIDVVPGAFRSMSAGRTVPESVPSAPQTRGPLMSLLGTIDLLFVVVYLVPLVVLCLCYGLMAEKDGGLLPIVLSQPVSLRSVVSAKLFVRFGFFVAVSGAFALPALSLFLPEVFGGASRLPLATWIVAALLYSTLWFALAALVNALGRPSLATGLMLGGVWLLWVFFASPLTTVAAQIVRPVPSRVVVVNAKRDGVIRAGGHQILEQKQELETAGSPTNQLIDAYFRQHSEFDASRLSFDDRYRMVFFLKMAEADRLASVTETRWTVARDAQRELIDRLRFASPASLVNATLLDLSGTGRARYNDFLSQVDVHRRRWTDWVLARYAEARLLDAADYDRLPQFVYRDEASGSMRARVITNMLVMLGLIVVVVLIAIVRYRRYPIVG